MYTQRGAPALHRRARFCRASLPVLAGPLAVYRAGTGPTTACCRAGLKLSTVTIRFRDLVVEGRQVGHHS